MKTKAPATRLTAALLSIVLVQVSFGPEAWAQLVPRIGAVTASVGGPSANAVNSAKSVAIVASPLSTSQTASPLTAPAAFLSAPAAAADPSVAPLAPPATPAPVESEAAEPNEISAAAPIETAAVTIKGGSRAAGIGSRVSRRFAELKSFFGERKAQAIPSGRPAPGNDVQTGSQNASGLNPADKKDSTAAASSEPASPTPSDKTANQKSINWFLGGMLVAQIGVEILGLAMPLLMRAKFGGFSALGHIAVASSAAKIVGNLTGGWIPTRYTKAAYVGATALRLLSITGMVLFLVGPAAPLVAAVPPLAAAVAYLGHFSAQMVLIGFYSVNGYMQGVAQTAERSIPNILLGNDRATMERFSSLQQWLLNIVGVSGPKAGGFLIQSFGFTAAIAMYPLMLTIAVAMYMIGIRMPEEGGARDAPKVSRTGVLFSRVLAPLRPMNRAIAGVFDKLADKIKAVIDGLVLKAYLGRWIEKMGGQGRLTDDDERKLLGRSTLGWMTAAMISLSGFLTLLLPIAAPAYAAMIVLGVALIIANQKLYSLMLSRMKGNTESIKVNAIASATYAACFTIALQLAGMLFGHFTGRLPFAIFAATLIPVATASIVLRRTMKRLDEQDAPAPAQRPTTGFGLLFKDPMARSAFLGYVLFSTMNPLLYQILSPAFSLMIVGGAAAAASGVTSWVLSLYSLGNLLGALYMWRESTLISAAKKAPISNGEASSGRNAR